MKLSIWIVVFFFIVLVAFWLVSEKSSTDAFIEPKTIKLLPINPPLKIISNLTTTIPINPHQQSVSNNPKAKIENNHESNIKQLMDKQINNATRLKINQQLIPTHPLTAAQTNNGKSINTSGIALSVMVQLLNEDGSAFSLDITSPLPLLD